MKYVVAIMVPEPYRSQLLKLQRTHRPAAWNISLDPHITLVAPSPAHLEPEAAIRIFKHLAPAPEFYISARQLSQFNQPNNHAIYLRAEPGEKLRQLSDHLYQLAIWQDFVPTPWPDFIPHITITNRATDDELAKALPILGAEPLDVSFLCRGLTLLGREPGWRNWKVLATSGPVF